VKGIQVCSNKEPGPLQRGDNNKNVKLRWGHLKIFFSSTTGPILTRLGTDDYVMGPRRLNGANGNEMHIIFLHGPRLFRCAMWPMGLLFFFPHQRITHTIDVG
jgi:hypothetical protein